MITFEKELKTTGTSGELGTLLDEIFEVYNTNGLFFPVEVEGGRKFKGLGFVLSQRQTNYTFSGHHVSATTYSAWDPIGRRTVEFNCKYNLMYYSKHPEERIDMEGYELDLDISDEERASAFKTYFTDLVSRAKVKCGSDYRYMKNYINVCTNRIIPWELLDGVIEIMVKNNIVSENRKVDSTLLRAYTNALIEDAELELISWEDIARACLAYMSEDDVRDMAQVNFDFEDDDEDEYDDIEDEDEDEPWKRDINESRKTTLTFNQLKKIIRESR